MHFPPAFMRGSTDARLVEVEGKAGEAQLPARETVRQPDSSSQPRRFSAGGLLRTQPPGPHGGRAAGGDATSLTSQAGQAAP